MSITLTSNFLANARGLTFKDGGGISWSINKNTNEITATGSGGGVLSSVGLADDSTTPIYTVSNSPLTANGTIGLTLKTQPANLALMGPSSGSAAQPGFRALVTADLPASGATAGSYTYPSLTIDATGRITAISSGTAPPSAANPSGTVGLATVNGSAGTFMRSDAAPALSQAIAPTWTGAHRFNAGVTREDSAGGGPFDVGYLVRPFNTQAAGYTLVAADRGKTVSLSAASSTLTVPSGVFAAGDIVYVLFAQGSGSVTIAQGSGMSMYWANGTVTSGNRTLTTVGRAEILFVSSTEAVISGSGLT